MDNESLELIRKVWKHTGVSGKVWMPHIASIGVKDKERFREGPPIDPRRPHWPDLRESVDWYWTPGISSSDSRKAKQYPGQKAIWVDCDESYDMSKLEALRPSFMWETSPGHRQAIWLLKDEMPASEYHRDGYVGMLTQALGADKSGVDIGQLLRVPGTWHHKRDPFLGQVLSRRGNVYTRGQLLARVAKALGFSGGLASDLGADDPYGDRSKVLWKIFRNAAELGLPQDLTFKMVKATAWNKWKDDPDRLKEDIGRAYAQQPATPEKTQALEQHVHDIDEDAEIVPWEMASVGDFGSVLRTPIRWVLPGIIPESGCGLIVAAPKVGKTRIAIELALGLASGSRPLGISTRRPQAVGFFSLEDGERLFAERLSAGMQGPRAKYHWDGHITPGLVWEPPQPLNLLTHFSAVDLTDTADQQRLYETILKHDLRLVIIDTLSMAIGKANVSDQKEMYAALKPLKAIAKATGCAVMFIHHTRKRVFEKGETIQESILGATALHGWSDFIISLAAPGEDSDLLRMGVQSKRGSAQHFINSHLKIIKTPPPEPVAES